MIKHCCECFKHYLKLHWSHTRHFKSNIVLSKSNYTRYKFPYDLTVYTMCGCFRVNGMSMEYLFEMYRDVKLRLTSSQGYEGHFAFRNETSKRIVWTTLVHTKKRNLKKRNTLLANMLQISLKVFEICLLLIIFIAWPLVLTLANLINIILSFNTE